VLRSASHRVLVAGGPACVGRCVVLPAVVLYAYVCCAFRRVGCLRRSVFGQVKVNCASGGPGSENRGGHGRVAVGLWWGFGWLVPVGVPSSPVPGGNQGPAGGATGGGSRGLSHGFSFAGCAPVRTLIGLRRPGEENTPTSGEMCALRSAWVPVHLRGYSTSPRKPSSERPGCESRGEISPRPGRRAGHEGSCIRNIIPLRCRARRRCGIFHIHCSGDPSSST
jgi:hypothetical protein